MQAGRLLRVFSALVLSGMALWFLMLWERQQNFPAGSPFVNPWMNFILPLGFAVIAYLVVDAVSGITQSWRKRLNLGLLEQVVMVCGVIIPVFAILGILSLTITQSEFALRSISRAPFSYIWHILFVVSVPVCNYFALKEMRQSGRMRPLRLGLITGLPLGVAFLWAVIIAPAYPRIITDGMYQGYQFLLHLPSILQDTHGQNLLILGTVLCILIFGFCLVASPVLCLVAGVLITQKIWSSPDKNFAMKASAFSCITSIACLTLMFLPDLPWIVTSIGMEKALSSSPEVSRAGIRILRSIGSQDEMLKACYSGGDSRIHVTELARQTWIPYETHLRPWSEQARNIFYRVTGKPFNTFAPPANLGTNLNQWERGGTQVGGRVNVNLESSSLEGHVDPNAALGYVEWTMIFRNLTDQPEEARTHIALPPGGVVSRLTLWVDNSPHEAVFNSRSLVRSAYQAVVQARRDPVLVETAGPDRVMMQCFPVPPKSQGKAMKLRMGISFPLMLKGRDRADFALPRFVENNFNAGNTHQIHLSTTLPSVKMPAGLTGSDHSISGLIPNESLCQPGTIIQFKRDPQATLAWCKDTRGYSDGIVMQQLQETKVSPPKQLFIVIDGSRAMADQSKELIEGLSKIPKNISTKVLFASDEISALSLDSAPDGTALNTALQELRHAPFIGGPDNLPYLQQALESAGNLKHSAVLWIHGPAPLEILDPHGVAFSIQNLPSYTEFYEIEAKEGPNKLLSVLYDPLYVRKTLTRNLPRTGTLAQDLEGVFRNWNGTSTVIQPVWSQASKEPSAKGAALAPSGDLVPLWARDHAEKLLASPETEEQATQFASKYRIVTRVTGAVVLESREQYLAFGLDPETAEPNFNKKKHDEEIARQRAEWFRQQGQARRRAQEAQERIQAAKRVVRPRPAAPVPVVEADRVQTPIFDQARDEEVAKAREAQPELIQEPSVWQQGEKSAEANRDYRSNDAPTQWLMDGQNVQEKSDSWPTGSMFGGASLPPTTLDSIESKRQVTDIEFLPAAKDSGSVYGYEGTDAGAYAPAAPARPVVTTGAKPTTPVATPQPEPPLAAPVVTPEPALTTPVVTPTSGAPIMMRSPQQQVRALTGKGGSTAGGGGSNVSDGPKAPAEPIVNAASPAQNDSRLPLQILALVLVILGFACIFLGYAKKRSPVAVAAGTVLLISAGLVIWGAPLLSDIFLIR